MAVQRAVAEAALRTLCSLYPRQTKILEAAAAEYLCHVAQHPDATRLGGHVADVLIKDRESDGFDSGPIDVVVTPGPLPPFEHQPDPTVQQMTLHAPHWGGVRPFGFADIADAAQEIPKPLDLDYVGDYNEVRTFVHVCVLSYLSVRVGCARVTSVTRERCFVTRSSASGPAAAAMLRAACR